ncbi:MAG: hypothetical protein ACRD4P_05210 [Bryobacteraceae bacterium]
MGVRKTRFLILGALALLGAGCSSLHKPGAMRIDPALETLVPSDTVFLLGARIDKIRDTDIYRKYLAQANPTQIEQFAQATGVDPRKDLWEVLGCYNGKTGLLLIRGKFDEKDIEHRLEARGAKAVAYKGFNLLGEERYSVVLINDSSAAAGTAEMLKAMIDGRDRGDHGLPPALQTEVNNIGRDNQIWMALTGGVPGIEAMTGAQGNLANVIRILRGIDNATAGLNLTKGLVLLARAECRDDDAARHVHDALRGVIGIGRLSTPDNRPELLKAYDAIQVNQDHTNVSVSANLPPTLVDAFGDLLLKGRR